MELNESPVVLLLNPKVDHLQKDLPVMLFETGEYVTLGPCFIVTLQFAPRWAPFHVLFRVRPICNMEWHSYSS